MNSLYPNYGIITSNDASVLVISISLGELEYNILRFNSIYYSSHPLNFVLLYHRWTRQLFWRKKIHVIKETTHPNDKGWANYFDLLLLMGLRRNSLVI